MPIYEFRCTKCGNHFDVNRPREKAGDPATCPDDGAEGQRLFTANIAVASSFDDDFDAGDLEGMGGMDDGMGDSGMPDMDDFDF